MADASVLPAVLLLAVGSYAIRLGGVAFGGSRAAALLDRWSAPAVAVILASVAATVRAPIVIVVVLAAATTAMLRLLGIP